MLCLKKQILLSDCFFLFFWILFRDEICVYQRRTLASKHCCSQWFHMSLQQHAERLLALKQICWFVGSFLSLGCESSASYRILNVRQKSQEREKEILGGELLPHVLITISPLSPWLPKIYRSGALTTFPLPPTYLVLFHFPFSSLASPFIPPTLYSLWI